MRFIFIAIINFIFSFSYSQNLVPNSGFEEFQKCPTGHSIFGSASPVPQWFSPTSGTPDYFNECSPRNAKASNNWAGVVGNYSGNGYIGIISFMWDRPYREYIGTELLSPLDSGVTYSLQFSFRLSSYSEVSSGQIGLVFMNEKIKINRDVKLSSKPVMVAMADSAMARNTGKWQTVSGDYVAKGGERFLLIGNFSDPSETLFYKIKFSGHHEPMLRTASYYYFDDVIVQPQVEFIEVPPAPEEELFKEDSLVVLRNVQFAYNSDVLNNISEQELNNLLKFLKANQLSRIEIYGHTDDQGSETYNQDLSLRRANSVVNYLAQAGIEPSRMAAYGFGKSKPLINSTSEMARAINRRVEVKLLE